MRLKNKLSIYVIVLVMVLLNLFSIFLIRINDHHNMKLVVDSAIKQASAAVLNIRYGNLKNRSLFSDEEIIELRNDGFLKSVGSSGVRLAVFSEEGKQVYPVLDRKKYEREERLFDHIASGQMTYMFTKLEKKSHLLVGSQFEFGKDYSSYYLLYDRDIEDVMQQQRMSVVYLMVFDLLAFIVTLISVAALSKSLVNPLESLTEKMTEVRKGNYREKIEVQTDIREFYEIERTFNDMSKEIRSNIELLQEDNQKKEMFINSLAHELRTPLTAIIGFSSILRTQDHYEDGVVKETMDAIYENGKRLERLSKDLIRLIRVSRGKVIKEDVALTLLSDMLIRDFMPRCLEEKTELTLKASDVNVMTDEGLLTILLSNVIDNALKAVVGREEKRVTVSVVRDDDGKKKIVVSDTGKGIPKEDIEKIFDAFFMVDRSRKNENRGFGLGLSICKEIAELLDIEISIDSAVDKGTKVILIFNENNYMEEIK